MAKEEIPIEGVYSANDLEKMPDKVLHNGLL